MTEIVQLMEQLYRMFAGAAGGTGSTGAFPQATVTSSGDNIELEDALAHAATGASKLPALSKLSPGQVCVQ